jgi:hypothetical protein
MDPDLRRSMLRYYKRYGDRDDIAGWPARYDVTITVEHFGTAFYAVAGSFNRL